MKRQLIDILRLRVQKHVLFLHWVTLCCYKARNTKVIDMSDKDVVDQYNNTFVDNNISPVDD